MNQTKLIKFVFPFLMGLLLLMVYQDFGFREAQASTPPSSLTLESAATADVCNAQVNSTPFNLAGLSLNTYLPFVSNGNGTDQNVFLETFDGTPSSPTPWKSLDWDITVHSRDEPFIYALKPMNAQHGPNCEGPPVTHNISAYEDAVFSCKNHTMTAIYDEGYGLIYLTPNAMVDFSQGEAVIRFDMSTLRTSFRDWVDIWITPFDENVQLTLDDFYPDLNGGPRHSVHVTMGVFNGQTVFGTDVFRNFNVTSLPEELFSGYEEFFTPSAMRRDTFELRISKNHLRFGMPADPADGIPTQDLWWVDTNISPALDWNQGVVQFGHHSYNPLKDCTLPTCTPNTWHWDNVTISPSLEFTLIHSNKRYVDETVSNKITFDAPSPENAFLRFAGRGKNIQFSLNNGQTWITAQLQDTAENYVEENFQSYWTPIPAGVTSVLFKGTDWYGGIWHIRDVSIWANQ